MLGKIFILLVFFTLQLFAQNNTTPIIVKDKEVQKAADLYEKEDYKKAQSVLENIIDKNDKNAEAYYVLSRVLFKLDELDDAIDVAEESVERNGNNADYHFNLSQLYIADIEDASIFRIPSLSSSIKEELLATLKLDPKHVGAIASLANFYLRAPGIMGGSNDKAIEQANKLIKIDEERGRLILARIYIELEDYNKAAEEANKLIKVDEYQGRRLLIQILGTSNNLSKIEEEYKLLESKFGEDSEHFSLFNEYGYFLLQQNRIDEAIYKFKKQVTLVPKDANAHDSLGEGYLKKGMYKESLAEYQKALELNPKSENAKDKIADIKKKM